MMPARLLMTLMVVTLCGIWAGCNQREGSPEGAPEKVTLALATIQESTLALIAEANGYYRQEGLEVTTHRFQYGKPALQEVLQGKADFATVAETPVMFAITGGKRVSIIATIMTSSSSHAILARKDRGILEFKDLRGKTVATTLGTTAEFFLYSILVTHGISMDDIEVVDLRAEAVPEALARGDVDAAVTFLPYTALTHKILGQNCVEFQDKNVYRISFNVVSTPAFVQQRPATVRKVLKALIKAENFVKSNPAEAQKIVAASTGLKLDLVREIWSDTTMSTTLDQTLMLSLEDETEWAMKNGLTRATKVPNYLEYIHLAALRSLKPDAVRILK